MAAESASPRFPLLCPLWCPSRFKQSINFGLRLGIPIHETSCGKSRNGQVHLRPQHSRAGRGGTFARQKRCLMSQLSELSVPPGLTNNSDKGSPGRRLALARRKVGLDWAPTRCPGGAFLLRLARPLTRPSGTLSPGGEGNKARPPLNARRRNTSSPSPLRGEGWGEGASIRRNKTRLIDYPW